MKTLPKPLALFLKGAVTVLAVWLVVGRIDDFSAIRDAARGAHWGWLLLGLVMQYAMATLNALRWKELVSVPGVGMYKYLYYVFVGHFLNLFLPSAVLAEGARTYAFGKKYGDMQRNFAAALFGRGCGFLVQIVFSLVFILLFWSEIKTLEAWGSVHIDAGGWIFGLVCVMVVGGVVSYRWRERVRFFLGILMSYARDFRRTFKVLFISLLIQLCMMLATYMLFRSLTPDVRFWHVAIIPILIQLLLLFPISAGGVGVREYLSILFYADLAGLPVQVALMVSLLGYVYWGILAATGAGWMLYRRHGALATVKIPDK